MKTLSSSPFRHRLRLVILAFVLVFFAAPAARAGLTVDIHLYHDKYGYYFYPWLSTNEIAPNFPDGNYMIGSPQIPTGGSQLQYQATNGTLNYAGGGGNYYGDFNSFLYGITNGQWSIWVTNSTSTNQYQFAVTVGGVTSNSFGAAALPVFPLDGAANVTNQPLFQWTGPAGWMGTLGTGVYFIDTNGNYNYEATASLSPDQTSWQCPVVLPNGTNDFNADYSSNATALIIASTPQNNASQPISGWSSTSTLETSYDIRFTVGMIQGQTNLVTNGGFETGDLSGWTLFNDDGGIFTDTGSILGNAPYSGSYAAAFGTEGALGYLSQTLSTTPGTIYLLSFWLDSPDGQTPTEFQVSWNGTILFDETNLPALGWTNLQFLVMATGPSTVLQFGGQDDPSYLGLDDVSVEPVQAGGFSGGHTNVAHYTFDTTSTNTFDLGLDSSPDGNNLRSYTDWGQVHTNATDAVAGGGAVQFFGTSSINAIYQTLTNLNEVLAGSFTFSAWVKTTASKGNDTDNAYFGATIFWAYNIDDNTNDTIPLAITGGKAAFTTRGSNPGAFDTLHSITSVNDGNYHLITVTRDQSSGEKKIYVDGHFEASETGTTNPLNGNINGNNYQLTVGGTVYSSYTGLLDDLQIYTGVLSDAEVASLYASPGNTIPDVAGGSGGPMVHYDFDEGTVLAADVSGNGNNMVHAGNFGGSGPAISANTAAGSGAVSFDGGSYLTASPNLLATLAGSFSISLWVKTTQDNGDPNDFAWTGDAIVSADIPYSGANDLIPVALTGGQVAFNTANTMYNYDDTINSSATVDDGQWHHVVVSRNQPTGEKFIYIDGVLDTSDFDATNLLNDPKLLTIGCKSDASNPDPASPDGNGQNGYEGLLDDIQIYSRVLSAGEVAFLHNNPGAVIADSAGSDFAAALNTTNLTWTTSGDANWFVETTNTHDNVSAAQSGSVTNNQSSTLSTTVTGPGTLTFYWSSQGTGNNFDYVCYLDGDPNNGHLDDIYYNTAWYQDGPFNIPAGQHTISWTAYSNGDNDPTQAGFLDQVSYVAAPPNTAPVITVNPFSQTNYPGYNVALFAAATSNPTATWQWFKLGSGLIAGATTNFYIPTNSGTAGVAGSYYAVASNLQGAANTTTAAVTFVSAPLPPDWSHALKSPFQSVDSGQFNKDYYLGCAVDAAGDVYAAGEYFGSMDVLTNGYTENILTATNSYGAALVKHDANGSPLWAVGLTNNQTGSSYGIAVAVAPGNGAYLSANCSGTNWLGTNQFVDVGGNSILLSRFDANGSNVWSHFIGGANYVYTSYNMVVSDAAGYVTLAGYMSGTVSFGSTNLSAPSGGGFLVQYDTNGVVRWAQTFPNSISGLAYGGGRLYASLQSTVSGGVTNVSIGSVSNLTDRAWAVAALDATSGQILWLRGVGDQYGSHTVGLVNDEPRVSVVGTNVFLLANTYGSSVVFGNLSVPLPDGSGQYFARYDTDGNPQAASVFGSASTMIWAVAASANGVYVCGDFDYYSRFGSDIIAAPVYAQNDLGPLYFTQPFIAKFDYNGNSLWARNGVSSDLANFRGIATTADGVWASGFLKLSSLGTFAQFGNYSVYGDYYIISVGIFGTIYPTQGGMIAKITDTDTNPVSVNLTMNIYRYQSPSFGDSFYVYPNFNSVTPAATGTTTNTIESPTLKFHGEINASGNYPNSLVLFSIDQLNSEFTNGPWSLYINKGLPNERLFHFTASVSGLTTNLLSAVTIITPTNGATGVLTNSPFQWFGPTNFSSLNVNKQNRDGSGQASASLAVTVTNWPSPPALAAGTNVFSITYTSNNFPNVAFTVPVDTNSLSVSNWATQFNLLSTAASIFVVSSSGSPVQLTNVSQSGGNFQFSFTSSAGFTNAILYRTNLVSGIWLTYSNVIGDGTVKNIAVPLSIFSPSRQGFIRVSTQ